MEMAKFIQHINFTTMSKQKRKQTSPQLLKQQEAEIKKKYKQKVKWLFTQFGHEQLFSLVPDIFLNTLFSIRFRTPHIACKGKLPHGFKSENELNIDLISFLKKHRLTLSGTQNKISYYEYFTCGFDFNYAFLTTDNYKFKDAEFIKETLKAIHNELYTVNAINQILDLVFANCYTHYFSFNYGHYTMHLKIEEKESSNTTNNSFARIAFSIAEVLIPQPIDIKIGNYVRPAFEVGWVTHDVYTPVCLNAADLYLDQDKYPAPIPVYIQNHAIMRLTERIPFINPGISQFFVVNSLLEHLRVRQIEEKTYLLDYFFYDWKIGYLRADFIQGKLIIRTFLLSTQENTPESEKFKKITRLRRDDIEYLKMTCLGDFADSGIENNPRLGAIFEEAGLTSLLECAKHFYFLNKGVKTLSERVTQYLTIEQLKPNWHEVAETIKEEELA